MTTAKNKTTPTIMKTITTTLGSTKLPLTNQKLIIARLLQSLSNHCGFDDEYIKDSTKHNASHWRKIGMYILVKQFGFTYEHAANVFGKKAPHAHVVVKEIKEKLETEGVRHEVLPYINQVMFDIES